MKIKSITHCFLYLLLLTSVFDLNKARAYPPSFKATHPENINNIFVDKAIRGFPAIEKCKPDVLQLISHGRPGELLLDGQWCNAIEIANYIRSSHLLQDYTRQINIYGCEFAKGPKGKAAIAYLKRTLQLSIAASDNITGKGGDWVLEVGTAKDVLNLPEYSASLQYAPTDDLDGDGTLNFLDVDDDNDGVLDAIEAPSCYYTAAEMAKPSLITSQLTVFSTQPLSLSTDDNLNTYSRFNTPGNPITGVTLYEITLATPLAISSINFSMVTWAMTYNASSTVMLQGFNGTTWDNLGPAAAHNLLPSAGVADTFKNTLAVGAVYSKYRIQGVAGTASYSGVAEISITPSSNVPSLHPKSTCAVDLDNDGITNDKDLDSDGDGCPDAREAGVYNQAGVATSNGSVKNGSGGAVTSTVSTPNAVVNGPYGSNGFANSVRLASDVNSYKGIYTYSQYATSGFISLCADFDGDGVLDLADIDDDNDGILDATEAPDCYFSNIEIGVPLSVSSGLTLNSSFPVGNSFDESLTTSTRFNSISNPIAGVTLYDIIPKTPLQISNITFRMGSYYMTSDAGSTVMLQGYNGSSWDTLSTIAAHNTIYNGNAADIFNNALHPATIYNRFRIQGVAGTNYYSDVSEITITPLLYVASKLPKTNCTSDSDSDGVTNNRDLDSDGDGCTDAREAGVYNQAGVTATAGNVQNGSGGAVTSTTIVANALIAGPYGSNGFSDVLQGTDTNTYKYQYSYPYALSSTVNACTDSDNDSIPDIADIDDDNDGVLDKTESSCYNANAVTNCNTPNAYIWAIFSYCTGWKAQPVQYGTNTAIADFDYMGLYNGKPYYDLQGSGTVPRTGKMGRAIMTSAGSNYTFTVTGIPSNPFVAYGNNIAYAKAVDVSSHIVLASTPLIGSGVFNLNFGALSDSTLLTVGFDTGLYTSVGMYWQDSVSSYSTSNSIVCVDFDTDNDGIPNRLDLDSDGDGCTDARESGTYIFPGATTSNGAVKNGSNHIVTSAISKPLAIINGPYGSNGFADILQALGSPNIYAGVYTYDSAINAAVHSSCNITTDTLPFTPPCVSCGVTPCVNYIDVDSVGAVYNSCSTPAGYTRSGTGPCFTYTATGPHTDTVQTCITLCNNGICDTTRIVIYPPITPDTVEVAPICPTCTVKACVVADDLDVDSTTTYTTCGLDGLEPTWGSLVLDTKGCLTWHGNSSFSDTVRTCVVACSYGKCDTTFVFINPPIRPFKTDTIKIRPPAPGIPVGPICPTADDNSGYSNPVYSSCGLSLTDLAFGTLTINASGCATWIANGTQGQTQVRTCVVKCADTVVSGNTLHLCDTTVILYLPPPKADTQWLTPGCPVCGVDACPSGDDIEITTATVFSTCGAPAGYTITSGPNTNGCFTFTPNPTNTPTDTVRTCVVACDGNVCDTTRIIIYPPVKRDTVIVQPLCPNCPVTACPVLNDITDTTGAVFSSCSTPPWLYGHFN